jgi:hypothetical protein
MRRKSVLVLLMILFSAARLFTATRFTGAEDQSGRAILNPQNVPSWFETGQFRSARWDGAPLEAEKGILTGWVNYTRDDPRQVLKATRDWYNPRTIEFLRKAQLNWVWVTCSNGFSPATERAQQETLTRYIVPAWALPKRRTGEWVLRSQSGRVLARMPDGALYFEQAYFPFVDESGPRTISEAMPESMWTAIASPPGPHADGEDGLRCLAEGARRLREKTDRAIIGLFGGNLLEVGQFFYRNDNFFMPL